MLKVIIFIAAGSSRKWRKAQKFSPANSAGFTANFRDCASVTMLQVYARNKTEYTSRMCKHKHGMQLQRYSTKHIDCEKPMRSMSKKIVNSSFRFCDGSHITRFLSVYYFSTMLQAISLALFVKNICCVILVILNTRAAKPDAYISRIGQICTVYTGQICNTSSSKSYRSNVAIRQRDQLIE